jgi:hypothetical protein
MRDRCAAVRDDFVVAELCYLLEEAFDALGGAGWQFSDLLEDVVFLAVVVERGSSNEASLGYALGKLLDNVLDTTEALVDDDCGERAITVRVSSAFEP